MIHLVYGSDDNYWFYTAISAASAAYGTKRELTVHLFDIGISDDHYAEFERLLKTANPSVWVVRHHLSVDLFKAFGDWKGSLVTYSRMFMPELLPDLDWAIYVDGDTLWLGDIGTLWDLRDETSLVQASIDPPTPSGKISEEFAWYAERGIQIDPRDYLCMGLMLANLKKMRDENVPQHCRDFLSRYPAPRIVDQTVLNFVCHGKEKALPARWGVFSAWHVGVDLSEGGCIHYVSDVPWRRDKVNRLLSDVVMLWYQFARGVLGLDLAKKYLPGFGRWWRRSVYDVLRRNQWLTGIHPFVKSRFRNTAGMAPSEYAKWMQKFR